LSYLHVFPYSKRPDTAALELHDHIPEEVKKKRVEVIVSIGKSKKQTYMEKFLDREVDIIVEGKSQKEGYMNAISDNYLKILLPSEGLHSRQRLRARVFALSDSKLIAQPLIF
jgi:threonylcarbamoyladenosine tRNA methylthiotransferase MtaB